MTRILRVAFILSVAIAGAVSAGYGWRLHIERASAEGVEGYSAPALPAPAEVTIRAGETEGPFYFDPATVSMPAGQLRVTFMNVGPSRQHTFNVATNDGREQLFNSEIVHPGDSAVFEVTLLAPGTYTFYCILYGHADRGQIGELTVTP